MRRIKVRLHVAQRQQVWGLWCYFVWSSHWSDPWKCPAKEISHLGLYIMEFWYCSCQNRMIHWWGIMNYQWNKILKRHKNLKMVWFWAQKNSKCVHSCHNTFLHILWDTCDNSITKIGFKRGTIRSSIQLIQSLNYCVIN